MAETTTATDGTAPAYMTSAQLAELLALTPLTIETWRMRGEGPPFVRLGRTIRYSRVAVDAWLAERTVGGAR